MEQGLSVSQLGRFSFSPSSLVLVLTEREMAFFLVRASLVLLVLLVLFVVVLFVVVVVVVVAVVAVVVLLLRCCVLL
jgi:hypothetical protein